MRDSLNLLLSPIYKCLVLISVPRLEYLPIKVLGDLIQLSSFKYDALVAVVMDEKLPSNIRDLVPLEKNRMLIISTEG